MAKERKGFVYKLTEDELTLIRENILHTKMQQRALRHAHITYGKFRSILDCSTGLTKQQYERLLAFCNSVKSHNQDY